MYFNKTDFLNHAVGVFNTNKRYQISNILGSTQYFFKVSTALVTSFSFLSYLHNS